MICYYAQVVYIFGAGLETVWQPMGQTVTLLRLSMEQVFNPHYYITECISYMYYTGMESMS